MKAPLTAAEIDALRTAALRQGWPWGTRPYDLTLIGLRGPADPPDRYSDAVCLVLPRPAGVVQGVAYRATTRPGLRALRENRATGGVFSLAADRRHPLLWELGAHKGRDALIHRPGARALGYRDDDGDDRHDPGPALVEGRGINLHDPGVYGPARVGSSSEGCVVVWRAADVEEIRAAVSLQAAAGLGGAVSFALLSTEGRADLDAIRRRVAA